jgi:hypothetical protein
MSPVGAYALVVLAFGHLEVTPGLSRDACMARMHGVSNTAARCQLYDPEGAGYMLFWLGQLGDGKLGIRVIYHNGGESPDSKLQCEDLSKALTPGRPAVCAPLAPAIVPCGVN